MSTSTSIFPSNPIPVITPIIYPSAVEFWGSAYPSLYNYTFNHHTLTNLPSEYKVTAREALSASERLGLNTPISLFPGNINRCHTGKHYTTRRQTNPIPPNSFFNIPNSDIYIACPELTFLQAARRLKPLELIKLGFDLCSQYYLNQKEKYGQTNRVILTTPEQIIAYAKSSNHMHGSSKAIHAAQYVLDSSNSPMESIIAIIFELPIKLGGYGLPGIEMNGGIELSELGQELMGVEQLRGDLVWRKQRVAVEYNSKTVHNNDAAFYNDTNRITALKDSGWHCIALNPNTIHNFESMENIAEIIRNQLGLPPKKELLDAYKKVRQAVYNEFFKFHSG